MIIATWYYTIRVSIRPIAPGLFSPKGVAPSKVLPSKRWLTLCRMGKCLTRRNQCLFLRSVDLRVA
jgi:hypothetical protein